MKIDMHCHVREGSIDSKVPIEEFIKKLQSKGIGGMLVTDHDTYNGYRHWKNTIKGRKYKDFVVLKGIEYDTLDAGHIIVIMPENLKLRLMELRGMPVQLLIPIVHNYGGILGPAHPFGEKFMSFMNSKAYKRNPDILSEFDFIEVFNACESKMANDKALEMAEKYNLTGTAGSDSHKTESIGYAYTVIPDEIRKESQLIEYIKHRNKTECGGKIYENTSRGKLGKAKIITTYLFWIYNKFGGWSRGIQRNGKLKKGYIERIDIIDNDKKENKDKTEYKGKDNNN